MTAPPVPVATAPVATVQVATATHVSPTLTHTVPLVPALVVVAMGTAVEPAKVVVQPRWLGLPACVVFAAAKAVALAAFLVG